MRAILHRDIDQKRQVLLGAEANQLACWGEQGRLAQGTEIPSGLQGNLAVVGFWKSMPALQRTVNTVAKPSLGLLTVCHTLTTRSPALPADQATLLHCQPPRRNFRG
jgi:hypothetical protein